METDVFTKTEWFIPEGQIWMVFREEEERRHRNGLVLVVAESRLEAIITAIDNGAFREEDSLSLATERMVPLRRVSERPPKDNPCQFNLTYEVKHSMGTKCIVLDTDVSVYDRSAERLSPVIIWDGHRRRDDTWTIIRALLTDLGLDEFVAIECIPPRCDRNTDSEPSWEHVLFKAGGEVLKRCFISANQVSDLVGMTVS